MYTSGTTARPKGCLITHEALVRTAISVARRFGLTAGERFWDPLPFFHMGGLLQLTATLWADGAFLTMTHFEAGLALRQIADERSTFIFPCFPTITQSLIHHPDFAAADLSTVRGLLDTGPAESLREVERRFGVPVVTSYGLTEAGGVIAFGHLDDPLEQRSTTGGRPFRGMEARIVDGETGAELRARRDRERAPAGRRAVRRLPQATPRRRRRRRPAAGSRPAISAASTARAGSRTPAARRTCSRSAARTSPRSRSRPTSARIRR